MTHPLRVMCMPARLQELEATSQVSRSTAATALRHLSALQAATGAATGIATQETREARAARDLAADQCAELIIQLAASSEQLSCVCRHFVASHAPESECNAAVEKCGAAAERRMMECDEQMAVLQAKLERSRADARKAWCQVTELKADRDATVSQLEQLKLQVAELSAHAASTARQLPTREDTTESVHRGETSSDLEVTVGESLASSPRKGHDRLQVVARSADECGGEQASSSAGGVEGVSEPCSKCREWADKYHALQAQSTQSSHVAAAAGQMEECVRCDEWATRLQEAHSLAQTAETRWQSSKQACEWLESQLAAANQVPCPCT